MPQQRTNRTYGYLSVKKPPIPGLIHAVWPFVTWFTENIFREDKEIVEYRAAGLRCAGRGLEQRSVSRPFAICAACWRAAAAR